MKVKRIKNKFILSVLIGIVIVFVLLFLVFYNLFPKIFDIIYGDEIINQILDNISGNLTDIDNIALSIMEWEKEYFYNPYVLWNPNSILQKYGIYNINGTYRWFIRGAPVSWIIYSKLANCEEYARVFTYLMSKKGFEARIVYTPGEDHAWAEYYSEGYKIVLDPSENKVVLDKKKFAEGKNWSYIESVNIFNISDKKDVSDEYIKRGKINIHIIKQNRPIDGISVFIKSPYLMKTNPERYKRPKVVLINTTDRDGKVFFKLGEKEYIVEVKKSYFIFDIIYSKNITVTFGKETNLTFDLSRDKSEIKFFNWFE
jgi:hypothetical protein